MLITLRNAEPGGHVPAAGTLTAEVVVMAEISRTLLERFSGQAAGHREAVIVTLQPGTGIDDLASAGLDVSATMLDGTIVAGTLDASGVRALGDMDSVVRVESDGEMHALD
jgi:hypothetical protein